MNLTIYVSKYLNNSKTINIIVFSESLKLSDTWKFDWSAVYWKRKIEPVAHKSSSGFTTDILYIIRQTI